VYLGGAEGTLLTALKRDFIELRHAKPPASRSESAETYVVATGFRGSR
jgi:23S rRNA (uridine2552-2'-O)-methyltransferase